MKKITITLLFLLSALLSFAQNSAEHNHDDKCEHHDHKHHKDTGSEHGAHFHVNDFGFANGMVYNLGENSAAWGMHLHYVRGVNKYLGVGIGYESVLGEHFHQTFTGFVRYKFFKHFVLNAGPGITIPNEENPEYEFVSHFELSTVFELGKFHLGPMVGYGLGHEQHFTVGVHLGYGF